MKVRWISADMGNCLTAERPWSKNLLLFFMDLEWVGEGQRAKIGKLLSQSTKKSVLKDPPSLLPVYFPSGSRGLSMHK